MTASFGACIKQDPAPGDTDPSATDTSASMTDGPTTVEPTTDSTSDSPTETGEPGLPDDWDSELETKPGTRLRPILRVADDGSKYLVAWQDTLLDVRCAFRSGADGVQRCYPEAQGELEFGDASCTLPIVRDQNWSQTPSKILEVRNDNDLCNPGTFFRLGEPFTGTVHFGISGECQEIGQDPGYFLVTEVAPAEFVTATITPATGTSRIVPLILDADDGSRAIVGAWDREHAEHVAAGAGAEDLRWFGRYEPISVRLFGDAACSEPIGASACLPADETPGTARRFEWQGCEQKVLDRRRVVAQIDPQQVFRPSGDQCGSLDPQLFQELWSLSDVLTDDDFGLVTVHQVDGARLGHILHGNPEGEPFLASAEFFDPELDATCRFRPSGDQLVCVPVDAAGAVNSYLDAACTQQIAYATVDDNCLEPPPQPAWAVGPSSDGSVQLLPVLAPTPNWGGFRLDENDTCVEDFEGPPGGSELVMFTVGEPLPAGAVAATDVVQ
ncbi:hypothetical protein [Nannocystis sp. SCPEA4]|uniref:DUF7481 family protein n=1 Tax=Nannocystis sp. SCPEA4 TaxID=2996787 RepID=UPI00227184E6|nr:hypothetical protein [Nannocystis sp. SCPEA4]MCY1057529.1 hypothetical protein [Nannocystis sp. SCPEA4]